ARTGQRTRARSRPAGPSTCPIESNEGASPRGCFPQALSEPCEQLSLHTALRIRIGEVDGPRSWEVLPSRWFVDFTRILFPFAPRTLLRFLATTGTLPSERHSCTDQVTHPLRLLR